MDLILVLSRGCFPQHSAVCWDAGGVRLLPLGINLEDMADLDYGKTIGNATALLLTDSGYAPSNPSDWIAALQPQVALISVSPNDKQDLPSPETLELLRGYTILRTDRNGWIELSTDGESMWVEVERK